MGEKHVFETSVVESFAADDEEKHVINMLMNKPKKVKLVRMRVPAGPAREAVFEEIMGAMNLYVYYSCSILSYYNFAFSRADRYTVTTSLAKILGILCSSDPLPVDKMSVHQSTLSNGVQPLDKQQAEFDENFAEQNVQDPTSAMPAPVAAQEEEAAEKESFCADVDDLLGIYFEMNQDLLTGVIG